MTTLVDNIVSVRLDPGCWRGLSLAQLVEQLNLAGEDPSIMPSRETLALFCALHRHGWDGAILSRPIQEDEGTFGMISHTTYCLEWRGERLNARGESFEDMIDGRYIDLAACYDDVPASMTWEDCAKRAALHPDSLRDRAWQRVGALAQALSLQQNSPAAPSAPKLHRF